MHAWYKLLNLCTVQFFLFGFTVSTDQSSELIIGYKIKPKIFLFVFFLQKNIRKKKIIKKNVNYY
jgi:hypothetical protein